MFIWRHYWCQQQQQSFSRLLSGRRSYFIKFWCDSWVQTSCDSPLFTPYLGIKPGHVELVMVKGDCTLIPLPTTLPCTPRQTLSSRLLSSNLLSQLLMTGAQFFKALSLVPVCGSFDDVVFIDQKAIFFSFDLDFLFAVNLSCIWISIQWAKLNPLLCCCFKRQVISANLFVPSVTSGTFLWHMCLKDQRKTLKLRGWIFQVIKVWLEVL